MDYTKLKVTDLKAELKNRGIPLTGLKLKQNFIDRLHQSDAEQQAGEGAQQPPTDEPATKEPVVEATSQQTNEPQPDVSQQEPRPSEPKDVAAEPTQDTAIVVAPQLSDVGERKVPEAPSHANEVVEEPAAPSPQKLPEETSKTIDDESRTSLDRPTIGTDESTPARSTTEAVDDSRKRKRRSQSPPPSPETAAQKKAKAEDGTPRVMLKDTFAEGSPRGENGATEVATAQDVDMTTSGAPEAEQSHEGQDKGAENKAETEAATDAAREVAAKKEADRGNEKDAPTTSKPAGNDARFKGLFPTASNEQTRVSPPEEAVKVEDEGRVVAPALHPATSSLYIRDFMRPLQPGTLKTYLASLATPPKASPNPDAVLDFFLDSIRTHCFATFPSISSASRVRSALHGAVWPQERSRKPLWVDFVPEEKVKEWIRTESDTESRGRGAPRWEVVYDEDDTNGMTAHLQEAGAPRQPIARAGEPAHNMVGVPSGPRADIAGNRDKHRGSDAPPTAPSRQPQGKGFQALDDRFLSTTAKPKLYFLPVSREVSDQRLDRFAEVARRGPLPRPGGDEMRRFTFEDTDFFVDKGPEYGLRGVRGGRGRRGGGGGGGGGGGFGDRSGWRDSNWRGRPY